ncbi:MAG: endolytic transglycosylase MltG [Intrasporangium sp.]|uniref:endolytic transglycosylase MltG n=1 Tax=Intrasporangium sp. TaxID=1925024 RepID=UPI00264A2D48|nr:endolytic transglycosylase MltG [Intrasporangium sp.]MDN5794168.1 endolytic transglycosylase MltG [Intrasporangium sp.]
MNDPLESSIFGDHDEHVGDHRGQSPAHGPTRGPSERGERARLTRRESRRAERRSAKSRRARSHKPPLWRRIAVITLALAVIGGGVAVAYTYLRPVVAGMFESNDYPGPGSGEVPVVVEHGDTGAAIATTLVNAGVVKSTKAYIEAAADNPKSAGIQPGTYRLRKQMSAAAAVAVLVDPDNRITTQVTIREGLWAKEIYAELSKHTGIPVADYAAAAKDGAALGLPPAAKGNVEGYLFPAKYSFDPGTTAKDQLAQMVAQSVKRLEALGVPDERMERTVIIASLVEAEARRPEDRPKVARVIENRLAKKMKLQLDSTVNYAAGKHGITTSDADRASKSPYNTYVHASLPPGPIGNPGESAITAAVHPATGPWLYFVTVNPRTGETKFAVTLAEHEKNVAQFQAWCAANKGTC